MKKQELLNKLNSMSSNTLMETLQIEFTDVGKDYLVATMPVNAKVHQPMGILHGGATVALAESVASAAAHISSGDAAREVRGIEISANHVRSKKEGTVFATARNIHKGRSTQLWEVRIEDEEGRLLSVCKMTTIVLPEAGGKGETSHS
jgi:uncharacterized protein (TIGR00369 family)